MNPKVTNTEVIYQFIWDISGFCCVLSGWLDKCGYNYENINIWYYYINFSECADEEISYGVGVWHDHSDV